MFLVIGPSYLYNIGQEQLSIPFSSSSSTFQTSLGGSSYYIAKNLKALKQDVRFLTTSHSSPLIQNFWHQDSLKDHTAFHILPDDHDLLMQSYHLDSTGQTISRLHSLGSLEFDFSEEQLDSFFQGIHHVILDSTISSSLFEKIIQQCHRHKIQYSVFISFNTSLLYSSDYPAFLHGSSMPTLTSVIAHQEFSSSDLLGQLQTVSEFLHSSLVLFDPLIGGFYSTPSSEAVFESTDYIEHGDIGLSEVFFTTFLMSLISLKTSQPTSSQTASLLKMAMKAVYLLIKKKNYHL